MSTWSCFPQFSPYGEGEGKEQGLFIRTFGCQMNEYDSQRLARMLVPRGYGLVQDARDADVVFINTCSVRSKAEQKLYSFLGRMRRLKERNPHLLIVVGGCVAEQVRDRLFERFPYVDIVVGTRGIVSVPDLIGEIRREGGRRSLFPEEEISSSLEWLKEPSSRWRASVAESVTIMQGCNNFCSYCIVPYLRGRERSKPPDQIVEEIRLLAARGAREILLLGQNVNSYGQTLTPPIRFATLIERIARETEISRLRFTTSHPKDLTDDLMVCFRDIDILCPHLHLPFQAGSDRILALMNRGYTKADYLRKVERLRSYRPDIALTADVMVGFPSEREEDFQETMDLIRDIEFDGLFSFCYSDRPFTPASTMTEKVDEVTKRRRLMVLQSFQEEVTLRKHRAEEHVVREVLVEGYSRLGSHQLMGRTPHNRIVNFDGSEEWIGKIVAVEIIEGYAHSLRGVATQPVFSHARRSHE